MWVNLVRVYRNGVRNKIRVVCTKIDARKELARLDTADSRALETRPTYLQIIEILISCMHFINFPETFITIIKRNKLFYIYTK